MKSIVCISKIPLSASMTAMSHYAITKINKTFAALLLLSRVLIGLILLKTLLVSGRNSEYEECRQH